MKKYVLVVLSISLIAILILGCGKEVIEEKKEYKERTMEVKGRDFQTGLPKIYELGEKSINEAIQRPLKQILEGIKEVLSLAPPELAADIVDKGIVLSGGTALFHNIDRYITYFTGVPSFVVDEPLFCVIRGVGMAIENLDDFKDAIR